MLLTQYPVVVGAPQRPRLVSKRVRTPIGLSRQFTRLVLLLPVPNQLGQSIKLAPAFGQTQMPGKHVTNDCGFEFERKYASLNLLFLATFLPCFISTP